MPTSPLTDKSHLIPPFYRTTITLIFRLRIYADQSQANLNIEKQLMHKTVITPMRKVVKRSIDCCVTRASHNYFLGETDLRQLFLQQLQFNFQKVSDRNIESSSTAAPSLRPPTSSSRRRIRSVRVATTRNDRWFKAVD